MEIALIERRGKVYFFLVLIISNGYCINRLVFRKKRESFLFFCVNNFEWKLYENRTVFRKKRGRKERGKRFNYFFLSFFPSSSILIILNRNYINRSVFRKKKETFLFFCVNNFEWKLYQSFGFSKEEGKKGERKEGYYTFFFLSFFLPFFLPFFLSFFFHFFLSFFLYLFISLSFFFLSLFIYLFLNSFFPSFFTYFLTSLILSFFF